MQGETRIDFKWTQEPLGSKGPPINEDMNRSGTGPEPLLQLPLFYFKNRDDLKARENIFILPLLGKTSEKRLHVKPIRYNSSYMIEIVPGSNIYHTETRNSYSKGKMERCLEGKNIFDAGNNVGTKFRANIEFLSFNDAQAKPVLVKTLEIASLDNPELTSATCLYQILVDARSTRKDKFTRFTQHAELAVEDSNYFSTKKKPHILTIAELAGSDRDWYDKPYAVGAPTAVESALLQSFGVQKSFVKQTAPTF